MTAPVIPTALDRNSPAARACDAHNRALAAELRTRVAAVALGGGAKSRAQLRPGERALIGGAQQMLRNDPAILRIHHSALVRAAKEVFRMTHEELVQRIVHCDHYGERLVATAPGAAGLLPCAGDRARIPGKDRGVQPADVDAELERICRGDAYQLAIEQSLLDTPALLGRISRSV